MENIAGKVLYIFDRLREPSSHASITAFLVLLGIHVPDATWNSVINGLAVLFGVLGVFIKEAKPETKVDGF